MAVGVLAAGDRGDGLGSGCDLGLRRAHPVDRTPANRYPEMVERNPVDISPEQLKFIREHGSSLLSESFYDWLVEENAKTLLPLIGRA